MPIPVAGYAPVRRKAAPQCFASWAQLYSHYCRSQNFVTRHRYPLHIVSMQTKRSVDIMRPGPLTSSHSSLPSTLTTSISVPSILTISDDHSGDALMSNQILMPTLSTTAPQPTPVSSSQTIYIEQPSPPSSTTIGISMAVCAWDCNSA